MVLIKAGDIRVVPKKRQFGMPERGHGYFAQPIVMSFTI
jgi:enoyl-CoA hydratase/carnithine racemase